MIKNVYVGWGPVGMTKIAAGQSKKLKLNKLHFTGEVDSTFQLVISSQYEEAPVWQSEDESVAIVDQNGNVQIVGYGKTRIIVRSGDLVGVCVINSPAPAPEPEPELPVSLLDKTKIYYGTIQSPNFMSYSEITEQDIKNAIDAGTMFSQPLAQMEAPIVIKSLGDAIVILVPDSQYVAKIKEPGGTLSPFKEEQYEVHANGEVLLGNFHVYGEMAFMATGTLTVYVGK